MRPLDESTWAAFARLVEADNGVFGGCWCMGMRPDDGSSALPERVHKLERVRAGTAHAALVLDGEDRLGRVRFGPPAEVPRIENRAACERGATTPPDPEAADAVPAGFLHHGALSTFEELGFQRDRPNGEHRWVVRTVVAPRWPGRRSARDTAP